MVVDKRIFSILLFALLGVSCSSLYKGKSFSKVYVSDFHSDDIKICGPADVDLSHAQAKDFFVRAQEVDSRVIHDHYNHAPCYIEGTLRYQSESCQWEIRAGATGSIRCGQRITYFVCDTCDDLFKNESL